MNEMEYIINKKSRKEYGVAKFIDGTFISEYSIETEHGKTECSCLSGMHRGYCKHKDWISALKKNQELPHNVKLAEEITQESLDKLMEIA
jgi:hypothetical protein